MAITDPLVLPDDLILAPVAELPEQVLAQIDYDEGDYALTRPNARTPSKIVDAQTAELLEAFRQPSTIVNAVIRYSRAHNVDAEEILVDAFPMVQAFMQARLLVPADSQEVERIRPTFAGGEAILNWQVVRSLQVLEDTELYQVQKEGDALAVLKILRGNGDQRAQEMFDREAAILRHLNGTISPRLYAADTMKGRPFLIMEWCPGVDATTAAAELRRQSNRLKLLTLCCTILDAYVHLHGQHVLHSDIHPRNILVDREGSVKLIDYGFARLRDSTARYSDAERAGVGFFFEPEYAHAFLAKQQPSQSTEQGEQYAVAALLYLLLTGSHYVDFSLERERLFRQIVEEPPLTFAQREVEPWPPVEQVLARALHKDPAKRFPSMSQFAAALHEVTQNQAGTNASSPPQIDISAANSLLKNVLQRLDPQSSLFASGIETAPICSINYGAAGIAYSFYRMAMAREDAALLAAADLWVNKALMQSGTEGAFYNEKMELTVDTVGRVSPYHTLSGVHAVQAMISHAMGDISSQQMAIEAFVQASNQECDNLDLTLGRCSTLIGCSLLFDIMQKNQLLDVRSVSKLGHDTLQTIWDTINSHPPIEQCTELNYLGIAHGWAGLLYATMRWCRSSNCPYPEPLQPRLQQLGALAEPTGRGARWSWMVKPHRLRADNYMPGWCNGSAGYIFMWTLAHRLFEHEAYLTLAEQAAWNAWEDSAMIGNLCCGLAGRAYGLLTLYKHTGKQTWLYRAQELANRAADAMQDSDMPQNSLYKGEVGVALLAADIAKPEAACMPFFEEEGWL